MKHTSQPKFQGNYAILLTLLQVSIWLTYRPYEGLIGDANLYLLQALAVIGVDFSSDLFFTGGSQAEFSLFPQIHAGLLSVLGMEIGQGFVYLVSSLLWLTGLWSLTVQLKQPPWARAVAVLCICVAGARYSVIGAAEQYVTARLPAEALSLFSLVFLLKRRLGSGVLVGLVAVLLHPLHGSWGLAVGIGYLLGLRLTLFLAAVGILCLTVGLDVVVANEWVSHRLLTLVTERELSFHAWRSPWLIGAEWKAEDSFRYATFLLMTLLGIASGSAVYKRLAIVSVVIISAALAVFWQTTFDTEIVRLILALQLWRGQWLLQVIAVVGLAVYLATCRSSLIRLTIFLAWMLSAWISYTGGFFFITLLVFVQFYGGRYMRPKLLTSLWGCFLALEILLLIVSHQFAPFCYGVGNEALFWQDVWRFSAMVMFLGILFLNSLQIGTGRQRLFMWGGVALLLAGAILFWDIRTSYVKMVEQSIRLELTENAYLPMEKNENLLWLDMGAGGYQMPHASWFLLKRPNFFSVPQMAGSIFSEHTYRVGNERQNALIDADLLAVNKSSRSYLARWTDYARMPLDEQKVLVGKFCGMGVGVLMSKRPLYEFHGKISVQGQTYYYFKCAKEGKSVYS